MAKFAGYGFNKSHAAAYALVAYQTAYLKANHPVEFMAASMTLDLGNTDKLAHFRQELDRLGIALLPPDINRSEVDLRGRDRPEDAASPRSAMRWPRSRGSARRRCRTSSPSASRNGPFRDLFDFAARLDTKSFNRRQFESLVKAGAFDCLDPNRAQSFAAAELLLRQASRAAEERESRQESLFAGRFDRGLRGAPVIAARRRTGRRSRNCSTSSTRSAFTCRATRSIRTATAWSAPASCAGSICRRRSPRTPATRFRLAGIVIGSKERTSARGSRFAFVQLSDNSGAFEVTVFSEVLAQSRALLDSGQPLIVTVDVRREEDSLRLTAQKIEPLDGVVAHAAAGLRVFVAEAEALPRLKSLISREAGGRGRVTVVLDLPSREVELALPGGFRVNPGIRAAVKSLPGILDVHDI